MAYVLTDTLCGAYHSITQSIWRCPKIWKQGKTYKIQRTVRSFIYNTMDPFRAQCMVKHMNKAHDKVLAQAEKVKNDTIKLEIDELKQRMLDKKIKEAEHKIEQRRVEMLNFFEKERADNEALRKLHIEPSTRVASTYIKNFSNSVSPFPYLQSKLNKWHIDRKYAAIEISHEEAYSPIEAFPDALTFSFDAQYYDENTDKDSLPLQLKQIAHDYGLYQEMQSEKELEFSVNYGKNISAYIVTTTALDNYEKSERYLRYLQDEDAKVGTIVYAGAKYAAQPGEIHRLVPLKTISYPNRYDEEQKQVNYNELLEDDMDIDDLTTRRILQPIKVIKKPKKAKIVPVMIYPDSENEDDQVLEQSDEDELYQLEHDRLTSIIQSQEQEFALKYKEVLASQDFQQIQLSEEEQSLSDDYDYGLDYNDMNY